MHMKYILFTGKAVEKTRYVGQYFHAKAYGDYKQAPRSICSDGDRYAI